MARRKQPGYTRTKLTRTKPAIPRYLLHIVPQKQLQTPEGHPKADPNLQKDFDKPWGNPPPDKYMTDPEWAVYWALTKLVGEKEFFWRYPIPMDRFIAGYYSPFADFFLPSRQLIILIGYEAAEDQTTIANFALSHDNLVKLRLENLGLKVIEIDAKDADTDPIYFASEALAGRDHSIEALGRIT